MRICGRVLRPSTLAERRLLLGLFGATAVRVPRSQNIFAVARRVGRYLKKNEDIRFLEELASSIRRRESAVMLQADTSRVVQDIAAAAE